MTHPVISYDGSLVAEIGGRLDLRVPNAEALDAVARRFDTAAGEPFTAVCDLATAVGKTYLAAGIVDYLAELDVRHFMIVTPGRTIQTKTIDNFTPGHPKSVLGGMVCEPLVITADDFASGGVAAALDDGDQVKLFVFTVQQLIRPTNEGARRTRKHQEWLGTNLYEHLRSVSDLVVIADECHVYTERAATFHAAVRELDAAATIGLTATPSPTDARNLIYEYPLARAIADRYVKTPVLVGRRDDATGVETQLRDGLALLEAKQTAIDTYVSETGAEPVNAVMFVVARSIDDADAVGEILSKPGLLGEHSGDRVLVIHTGSNDEKLARLAQVEDPASAVRVIVSVSMLKEGWDVRNIYVICSLRPSISEALTEQTLGRGLRLPWGAYTGIEMLDTVEVVSHERYAELLERAGALLEALVDVRSAGDEDTGEAAGAAAEVDAEDLDTPPNASTTAGSVEPEVVAASDADSDRPTEVDEAGAVEPGTPAIAGVDERLAAAISEAASTTAVRPVSALTMPDVVVEFIPRTFELSEVDEDQFIDLGRRLAAESGGSLERKVLDFVDDPAAPSGYRFVPRPAAGIVAATAPQLPFGGAEAALASAILALDVVAQTKGNRNGAKRLAAAVVTGAESEEMLAAYLRPAENAVRRIVNAAYQSQSEDRRMSVRGRSFAPVRVNARAAEPNRFGPFLRGAAYSSWEKSQHPLQWFDSSTERTLANLLDGDDAVRIWSRIQRGELVITWDAGRYSPDFYAEVRGAHFLFEVKADRDVDSPVVQAKAAEAQRWARHVTDDGDWGTWKYLLVSETDLRTARTVGALLTQAGARR